MAHSFIAYIDESGDDGMNGRFKAVGQRGGSSHWLTISASVWRYNRDLEATEWVREILSRFPNGGQAKTLHCQDLNHGQRVMASQILAEKPLRSICVMAHKPSLDPLVFTEKNQLYFYICRYVIERLSWLCRDSRKSIRDGDGRVKIVFSRRGKLSYEQFKAYLERLKADPTVTVNWGVIDIDGIEARDHSTRAGLQVSDIIATCMTAGLERDIYGNCETRYGEILKQIIYRRKDNFLSYGVKFAPAVEQIELNDQQRSFLELFRGN